MSNYNRGTGIPGQPIPPGQPLNRGAGQPTNLGASGYAGSVGNLGGIAGNISSSVTGAVATSRLTPSIGRDVGRDFEGEVYDVAGDYGASLRWSELPEGEQIVISGSSDASTLNRFKNILLALRN